MRLCRILGAASRLRIRFDESDQSTSGQSKSDRDIHVKVLPADIALIYLVVAKG